MRLVYNPVEKKDNGGIGDLGNSTFSYELETALD